MPHYKYFVGHKKPAFALWEGFEFFELPYAASTSRSFENNFRNNRIFNEYSSLFQIRRQIISSGDGSGLITICQHRRFVLNSPTGRRSTNQPWVSVLSSDEAKELGSDQNLLPRPGKPCLTGSAVRMKMSLLEQYASVHHIRDILRFSSALIDSEILSGAEVDEFLGTKFLIPSPSCGTFDVRSFLKIFETLEDSARAYWNDGYTPYDHPYQSRVCSFLLERLNSYLLVKHLAKENQALEDVAGSTIVISDGLRIGPGVVEGG